MKPYEIAFVIIVLQLTGCSSAMTVTRTRSLEYSDKLTVVELNKKIKGRTVTIMQADRTTLVAQNATLTGDSCLLMLESGSTLLVLPLSQIAFVEYYDHVAGGWSGLLLGGVGGLLLGAAVGSLSGGGHGEMGGLGVVVPATIGAAAGAVVGTVVGAGIGNTFRYRIVVDTAGSKLRLGNCAREASSSDGWGGFLCLRAQSRPIAPLMSDMQCWHSE